MPAAMLFASDCSLAPPSLLEGSVVAGRLGGTGARAVMILASDSACADTYVTLPSHLKSPPFALNARISPICACCTHASLVGKPARGRHKIVLEEEKSTWWPGEGTAAGFEESRGDSKLLSARRGDRAASKSSCILQVRSSKQPYIPPHTKPGAQEE
jgi:hypothetical protein